VSSSQMKLTRVFGQGAHGLVCEAVLDLDRLPSDQRRFAVKIFLPDRALSVARPGSPVDEFRFISSISHPNVIKGFATLTGDMPHNRCKDRLLDSFEEASTERQLGGGVVRHPLRFTVMNLMPCKLDTLWMAAVAQGRVPVSFSDAPLQSLVLQLLTAAAHLVQERVEHQDWKKDNLVLSEDYRTLAVADFSLAVRVGPDMVADVSSMGATLGNPVHTPPEVLRQVYLHPSRRPPTLSMQNSTVWSVAVVVWEMLTGVGPYPDYPAAYSSYFVDDHKFQPPIRGELAPDMPRNLHRALTAALSFAPSSRPTMEQLHREYLGAMWLTRTSFN
jgi:serine/threonine protein kinase